MQADLNQVELARGLYARRLGVEAEEKTARPVVAGRRSRPAGAWACRPAMRARAGWLRATRAAAVKGSILWTRRSMRLERALVSLCARAFLAGPARARENCFKEKRECVGQPAFLPCVTRNFFSLSPLQRPPKHYGGLRPPGLHGGPAGHAAVQPVVPARELPAEGLCE